MLAIGVWNYLNASDVVLICVYYDAGFGVLGVAVQRAVVQAMLDAASADLPQDMLEPIVRIGDLPEQ